MNTFHSGIGMTSQRTRARMIERLRNQGIVDEVVLAAMSAIPRHIFVEEVLATRAYDDVALPINFGQTISSPFTVARMSELLRAGSNPGKVLELGSGCGYQTAILAQFAAEVYSIERIGPLLTRARARLRELRLGNVRLKHADGLLGLPESAPFDAIILTAATPHIPALLLDQLSIGGRMILPKGSQEQYLCVIERNSNGYTEIILDEVRFVPMLPGILKR
ncbi:MULTISPECIES: protein-L-isoaspartate(D-aspartate) O-methyltransferase [unclassified Nitrosospira]|uniref:protein-L-isoaspartate(D-aspartate) O-methyltransferase n=1 Tax=unclassified Nitrosospira TaxID=2609267 RepID=UPI000D323B95|nr:MULTISPECIES: protein-L-isoaspartate(D-aspartate) O-methyltransferase [unclassified Nitrosospira]WON74880.1 protein-L-isoaspartate(D-aspartate) O-methyltransferase [Nitrosospira sp. Is2]